MLQQVPQHVEDKYITDTTEVTLSVVIPALNEERGIRGIVDKVRSTAAALRGIGVGRLEVIVVDDGSADATADRVPCGPNIRVVRHGMNRGYGAALKTGFNEANGDLLAFLDADSTYPPESLVRLCEIVLTGQADVAIGSRRSGGKNGMPRLRRLGNLIWSSLLTVIGGERVLDPASGMRVFRRRCLRRLYPLPDGLNFTPVMSTRALHEGLKVVEAPIPYYERSGRSKLSIVKDGLTFLSTMLWTAFQYNPGRLLQLGGLGALLAAGLLGALVVAARISGVTSLSALGVLTVYLCLVLSVGGVGALSMGVTFNRLVALFHSHPMRQPSLLEGMLGGPPERVFRQVGLAFIMVGSALAVVSVAFGLQGWDLTRLWLWLLGSSSLVLVGVQLHLFWMLVRVLDTLAAREDVVDAELSRHAHNAD